MPTFEEEPRAGGAVAVGVVVDFALGVEEVGEGAAEVVTVLLAAL